MVCMLFTVEAQFWGGFLQGALMGTQNALRQQQIRQQQECERFCANFQILQVLLQFS